MNCCIVVYYAWYTTYNDDYFLGYCADPVLGLSQHEIDVCSEYLYINLPKFQLSNCNDYKIENSKYIVFGWIC